MTGTILSEDIFHEVSANHIEEGAPYVLGEVFRV